MAVRQTLLVLLFVNVMGILFAEPDLVLHYNCSCVSPDRRKLLFVGGADLKMLDLVQGKAITLYDRSDQKITPFFYGCRYWSPDSTNIVFGSISTSESDLPFSTLMICNTSLGDLAECASSAIKNESRMFPSWSNCGTKIAYVLDKKDANNKYQEHIAYFDLVRETEVICYTSGDNRLLVPPLLWCSSSSGILVSDIRCGQILRVGLKNRAIEEVLDVRAVKGVLGVGDYLEVDSFRLLWLDKMERLFVEIRHGIDATLEWQTKGGVADIKSIAPFVGIQLSPSKQNAVFSEERNGHKILTLYDRCLGISCVLLDEVDTDNDNPFWRSDSLVVFRRKKKEIWQIDVNSGCKLMLYPEDHKTPNGKE